MNGSNGRHSSLYEQTLDYARREIDEASAQITKLRERLSFLQARMEAGKAVYEAVAARLNVEDEIGEPEETETRQADASSVVSREEIARLLHAQEPPPRETAPPPPAALPPPAAAPSHEPVGLSTAEMDLIRRHLEARHPSSPTPEPAPAVAATPARRGASGGLSDEDRRLIEEHLRRRIESERQSA